MAAASLLLALRLFPDSNPRAPTRVWNQTLDYYTTYTEQSLASMVRQLATIVRDAGTSKLRAVYNKFKQTKLSQISLLPLVKSTILDEIIGSH